MTNSLIKKLAYPTLFLEKKSNKTTQLNGPKRTRRKALKLPKIKTKKSDGWVFVYLGIDQNALAIAEKLGFDEGNIQSFARENLKKSVQIFSKATTVFRASASSSSEPFFNQTI